MSKTGRGRTEGGQCRKGGMETVIGVLRKEGTGVGKERGWSWSCMTGEGEGGRDEEMGHTGL